MISRRSVIGLAGVGLVGATVGVAAARPGKPKPTPTPTPTETPTPTPTEESMSPTPGITASSSTGSIIPASATSLFHADFNGGTVASFDTGAAIQHCPPTTEVTVASTFVREGANAAHFHVAGAGTCFGDSSHRAEVVKGSGSVLTHEGDLRWIAFSTYFPVGWNNPSGTWFIIQQWHAGTGSPPVAINIENNNDVVVGGDGSGAAKKVIGTVNTGQWTDYIIEVLFSNDPAVGYVKAWENNVLKVPKFIRRTMTSAENYFKMGIYRDPSNGTIVHDLWHDNITVYG